MRNTSSDPKRSGALTAMLKGRGRTVHSSPSPRGASFGRISKVAPALAVGALLAISAQGLVPAASAANDSGSFKIESRDSGGRVGYSGSITVTAPTNGGTGGGSETPAPSSPAVIDLTELTNGFYTRKASKDGVAQPVIEIPSLTISGADFKTPRDWELVIDRKMDPFNNGELKLRNDLPAWAKITYEKDRIVISNTEEWGRIGGTGENTNQTLGTLQFDYQIPSYTVDEMTAEPVLDNGRVDLKLATKNDQLRAYGRWTAKVDVTQLRAQLGNPTGAMHLKPGTQIANDSGFKLTKLTDNIYTLAYEGTDENRYIKGTAAATVEPIEASRLYDVFSFDAPTSTGEASNSSGVKLKTNLQSRWNYKIEILELGSDPAAPWSVDLNIKDLLDFDRSRTPIVYDSSNFSLVKKSTDVYTLSFKGGYPLTKPGQIELGLP